MIWRRTYATSAFARAKRVDKSPNLGSLAVAPPSRDADFKTRKYLIRIEDSVEIGLVNFWPEIGISVVTLDKRAQHVADADFFLCQQIARWLECPRSKRIQFIAHIIERLGPVEFAT